MSQHYSKDQLQRIAKLDSQVGLPFSTDPNVEYFDAKLYRDIWLEEDPKLVDFLKRRRWRVNILPETLDTPLGHVRYKAKAIEFFVGNRIDGLKLGMLQKAQNIHHHEIGHALDFELCGEGIELSQMPGMAQAMHADGAEFSMQYFERFRYFLTGSTRDLEGQTKADFVSKPFQHYRARQEAFAELYSERQGDDDYTRKHDKGLLTGHMPRTAQLVDRFVNNLDSILDYAERRDADSSKDRTYDIDLFHALSEAFKDKPSELARLLAKPRPSRPISDASLTRQPIIALQ